MNHTLDSLVFLWWEGSNTKPSECHRGLGTFHCAVLFIPRNGCTKASASPLHTCVNQVQQFAKVLSKQWMAKLEFKPRASLTPQPMCIPWAMMTQATIIFYLRFCFDIYKWYLCEGLCAHVQSFCAKRFSSVIYRPILKALKLSDLSRFWKISPWNHLRLILLELCSDKFFHFFYVNQFSNFLSLLRSVL